MSKLQIFAQLTKVDAEKRLVYGRAVDESPDRSGEVFDYATSKGHFEQWSKDSAEATDGKSLGNLRAMHGKVAAGKLTGIEFDDVGKAIDVVAHVVDDNEWNKVLEGVYTGFSIGGSYVKKWDDPAAKKSDGSALKRYTAAPSELSLVDRPCIPTAKFFDVQKADGVTEKMEFKSVVTDEQIEVLAKELCKEDGFEPDTNDTTDPANPQPLWKVYLPAATERLTALPDGDGADPTDTASDEAAKADATHAAAPVEKGEVVEPTEYEVSGTDEEVSKLASVMHDEKLAMKDVLTFVGYGLEARKAAAENVEIMKAEEAGTLKKGMYLVAQVAQLVAQLESIRGQVVREESSEGDTQSVLPTKSGNLLATACDLLRYMVEEESAELLNPEGGDPNLPVLAMAHFGDLKKIGARNSAADASRLQKAHDLLAECGATCTSKEAAATGDLTKAEGLQDVQKMIDDALAKAVAAPLEQIQKLETTNQELLAKVAKLEAQPAAPRGVLRAVSKGADTIHDDSANATIQPVVKNGEVNEAASLIKAAHQSGGVRVGMLPGSSS